MGEQQERAVQPNLGFRRIGWWLVICGAALSIVNATRVFAQAAETVGPRSASTLRNNYPAPLEQDDDGLLGGFYPTVTIAVARQGNVFRTPDNKQSDTVVTVSPALLYHNNIGASDLTVRYRADVAKHKDFSSEDTVSHSLHGDLGLDMTEKLQGRIGASYLEGWEQRGNLGSRTFIGQEPDHYRETSADAELIYGRRENTIQLAGLVGIARLRYLNNGQEERDRNSNSIGGRIYYNLGPRTSLFAGLERVNIDYVHPVPGYNLDSVETSTYVGARWNATAATEAEISVGRTKKDFDDPARGDATGSSYAGRVLWSPVDYSHVSFYGSRGFDETVELNSSYIISDLLGVSWNHALSSRVNVNAFYQKGKDKFDTGRTDKATDYGAGIDYGFASWLSVGAQYTRSERSSDVYEANYDDDLIMFYLTSNLGFGEAR